jgi:HAMP domain-containing protein
VIADDGIIMRLNIFSKIFLGFCIVILLNIFYVFIVNQLTDLNSIATILKIQEEVKNTLLKIDSYQGLRRRSRTSYEAIARPESVQRFHEAGLGIDSQMTQVRERIDFIRNLNTATIESEGNKGPYFETNRALLAFVADLERYSRLYNETFKEYISKDRDSVKHAGRKKMAARMAAISQILDRADQNLTQSLHEITIILDEQTKIVIKKIENRIDEVKRLTIYMLTGIVVVAIGFALFFSSLITNSMRRLKESAAVIGKGNFNFDPSGYPHDEIGDLASAFFIMATDLKNAQDELMKSRRLAAIGEVVASVNHEINNPLMIISGNAQFLEMSMTNFPPEMKDRVRIILEETDRISRVTKKLREIKNPVVEDYTSSGEQMINLEKSSLEA